MSIEQLLRPVRTLYPPQKRSLSEIEIRMGELGLQEEDLRPPAYEGQPEYDYVDLVRFRRDGPEHGVLSIFRAPSGKRSLGSGILVHILLSEEDDASASLDLIDLASRIFMVGSSPVLDTYVGEDCDWGDYISLKTSSQELCIYINSRRMRSGWDVSRGSSGRSVSMGGLSDGNHSYRI